MKELRKFAVKLNVSGTAEVIDNTKLYKDSFGFVNLRAFVPVTQLARGYPICTVHRVITDNMGQRKVFNKTKFNMFYVDTIDGYMLFECPMPKLFTDFVGDLDLVFNYIETNDDGEMVGRLVSTLHTYVDEGGFADVDIEVGVSDLLVARLNNAIIQIEQIEDSVEALLQPPDVSEADQVGVARVEITEDGRFKFIDTKGKTGATPQITVSAGDIPADEPVSVEISGTAENPHIHLGIPVAEIPESELDKISQAYDFANEANDRSQTALDTATTAETNSQTALAQSTEALTKSTTAETNSATALDLSSDANFKVDELVGRANAGEFTGKDGADAVIDTINGFLGIEFDSNTNTLYAVHMGEQPQFEVNYADDGEYSTTDIYLTE